ncbi:putative alpha/beta hydrolase [Ascodesmis nigricans]|uniref:Putative alpha/beta hydrolase n=1 Tax=Ascodesmis nigricans TaxID=341454 RepID=A0A4S2N8T5_9PEZI|nr:putative alpha/beta hydrolase [Ascodesmis nigricans]
MPFIQLSTSQVHYSDFLSGDFAASYTPSSTIKKTVVFIHGLGSSQNFYSPLIPLLPAGYRCILLDSPGSARSSLPQKGVTIRSIAETALELVEKLNITGKFSVVGHSMGCLVVEHIAQLAGERVEEMVMLGPVYPSEQLADVFGARIKTVKENGMEAMGNTVPKTALGPAATTTQRAIVRELLLGQTVEGYSALCNAIATSTVGEPEKVKAKTLIIAGSEDKSAPLDGCKKHQKDLNAELEIQEGMGHWHVVERPEEMAKSLARFFG